MAIPYWLFPIGFLLPHLSKRKGTQTTATLYCRDLTQTRIGNGHGKHICRYITTYTKCTKRIK